MLVLGGCALRPELPAQALFAGGGGGLVDGHSDVAEVFAEKDQPGPKDVKADIAEVFAEKDQSGLDDTVRQERKWEVLRAAMNEDEWRLVTMFIALTPGEAQSLMDDAA